MLQLAETSSLKEIPVLLGELEQIRVTALARLSMPLPPAAVDELLDVDTTAKRLGVSRDYLYRNRKQLPFARRIGRKLLFSSIGLGKYMTTSKAD